MWNSHAERMTVRGKSVAGLELTLAVVRREWRGERQVAGGR
jgi:hypothetical protein